jgi:hypothetical protein
LYGLANLMTTAPRRRIGDTHIILELTGRGARGSGGPPERSPKTSLAGVFGSYGIWYGQSVRFDDCSACTGIFGVIKSGRLDHGYTEGTRSHQATCA